MATFYAYTGIAEDGHYHVVVASRDNGSVKEVLDRLSPTWHHTRIPGGCFSQKPVAQIFFLSREAAQTFVRTASNHFSAKW